MTREEALAALDAVAGTSTDDLDIAETALAAAALGRGGLDLTPYRLQLAQMVALAESALAAQTTPAPDPRKFAAAVQSALHGQLRYSGDRATYDDLRNTDLAAVIDRKRGLPVSLGILTIHIARAIGANSHGINFPGHFLVGVGASNGAVIVDPFHGGRMMDGDDLDALLPAGTKLTQQHLAALSDRGTLIRLQNNILSRAQAAQDWTRLAAALETLIRLAPEMTRHRFDLGVAYAEGGQPMAARKALQAALARDAEADWAGEARLLLAKVSRSLN